MTRWLKNGFLGIFLGLFAVSTVWAQQGSGSAKANSLISTEDLRVKTLLEDMIVRRYQRELATRVESDRFSLGTRLEVVKAEKKKDKGAERETFSDLDLGFLDPDQLYDNYEESRRQEMTSFLDQYAIRKVEVSVGLKQGLSEEAKKEVQDWLSARVRQEFGSAGQASVQPLQFATESETNSYLKLLKDLQGLAGQLILALALLLATILWAMLSGNRKQQGESPNISINNEMGESEAAPAMPAGALQTTEQELTLLKQLKQVRDKVSEVVPKVEHDLPRILQEWSAAGKAGVFQIACLAEAVNSSFGKIPIPPDVQNDVYGEFATMSEASTEEKVSALEKSYWDLVAVLNLGAEAIHQPFSFVGGSPVATVNHVLMNESTEMSTVVSLFMPMETRKAYWKSLDLEKKKEMLSEAAHLNQMSHSDLEAMEERLAPQFNAEVEEGSISLQMTLGRLAESMSAMEMCQLLPEIEGPAIESYKREKPLLGFVHEWPDDALSQLLVAARNEEIMGLLAVKGEMQDKVLELVPPKTQQVLRDDLETMDQMSDTEAEKMLESLQKRIEYMVQAKELDLLEIFSEPVGSSQESESNAAAA